MADIQGHLTSMLVAHRDMIEAQQRDDSGAEVEAVERLQRSRDAAVGGHDRTEALFKDRVPEAAARQLAVVLASATEWNLATLEHMQMRRYSPKYELRRQSDICAQLVEHCYDLGVSTRGLRGLECTRLAAALAAKHTETPNG